MYRAASDGADPAHREDEAQALRVAAPMILHEQRQQDLLRTDEQQVGERRGEQRSPQPHASAHETEAFSDIGHRRGGPGVHRRVDGVRAHEQQRHDRDPERQGIDQERAAGAPRDEEPAQRRAGQPPGGGPHELVQRVGLDEQVARHQVGHDRVERRTEERGSSAVERSESHEMPELEGPVERQHAHRGDRQTSDQVGRQEDASSIEPVAHHPPDQEEQDVRDGHRQTDERESRRRIRQLVDLPRERDDEDPVAQQGDGHARPEQPEVPVPERFEDDGEPSPGLPPIPLRVGCHPHRSRYRSTGWAA